MFNHNPLAFGTARKSGTGESDYLYTEDLRGSTANVLDNSASQVVSYWYDDFGDVTETKASSYSSFDNELQYTGAVHDASTGLLYLNARFYDPQTGRFISRDTYRGEQNDADTWHLYLYCANNPVNYVDPSGHDAIVLKSNFMTRAIGHMAVLIQKGKNWLYFSWDDRGYRSKDIGTFVNEGKYNSVRNRKVYQDLNKKYGRTAKAKRYRKYLYIKGDFSGSVSYINNVKKGKSYKSYGFTTINCVWMALEVLKHGHISYAKKERIENMQYEYVWNTRSGKYVRKVKTVIPSTSFENLKKIFNVKAQTVKG